MGEWEVRIDDLTDKQREVADLIGFDNYLKLIEYYSADTIYIPKPDSFARIKRNQAIVPSSMAIITTNWRKNTV